MRHHALKLPASVWLLTASLNLLLVPAVVAGDVEVYRWKDANGKYHFSDQKPDTAADKVTIDTPVPQPNPELDQFRQQTRVNLAALDAEHAEAQRAAKTLKAIAARQERSCTALRNAIRAEEQVAVLYTLNTSGEMQHFTDEQRTRYKNDLHTQFQRYCRGN